MVVSVNRCYLVGRKTGSHGRIVAVSAWEMVEVFVAPCTGLISAAHRVAALRTVTVCVGYVVT